MGQMSLTRCLNLGLQALFLLVFALVMAQKMRGNVPKVPKFTPGEHVVEVVESGKESGVESSAGCGNPESDLPKSNLIVTDTSPIEPFQPYDAISKAIAAQAGETHRHDAGATEDDWDRQLKKLENHCTIPKLNL